jgi:hypothetical protein
VSQRRAPVLAPPRTADLRRAWALVLNTANIGISREMAKYFYAVFQSIFLCCIKTEEGASRGLTAASPLAPRGPSFIGPQGANIHEIL